MSTEDAQWQLDDATRRLGVIEREWPHHKKAIEQLKARIAVLTADLAERLGAAIKIQDERGRLEAELLRRQMAEEEAG